MKKEIVDNETDSYTLADFIREALQQTRRVDIATGFFNVSGFAKIKDELWQAVKQPNFSMRLLFGKETHISENPDIADCVDVDATLNEE